MINLLNNSYFLRSYYESQMSNNNLPLSAVSNVNAYISNNSDKFRSSTATYKETLNNPGSGDYYVYNDKGIPSEMRELHKAKYGFDLVNGEQLLAWGAARARYHFNEEINSTLEKSGISLSDDEKFSLTVDSTGKILVSGLDDREKSLKIEEALNNTIDPVELFTHIDHAKQFNGSSTTSRTQYHKMYARQIVQGCGQELEDLQLVNGEIAGANESLDKLINLAENGTDDYARTLKVHFDRLKSFLAAGLETIPETELTVDFQNGALIDRDVKYGFGPEQLKSWYNEVLSGKTTFNVKA